jgi:hypothetical protein
LLNDQRRRIPSVAGREIRIPFVFEHPRHAAWLARVLCVLPRIVRDTGPLTGATTVSRPEW